MSEIIQKLKALASQKRALVLIGIFAGLVVLVLLVISGFSSSPNPGVAPINGKAPLTEKPWQDYASDLFGFTISYPSDWSLKEEVAESGPDILISDKTSLAFVRIRAFLDPYLNSAEALTTSIEDYRKMLALQEKTIVSDFRINDLQNNIGGFSAKGEFLINGVTYNFEEQGKLSTQGQVLLMRVADVSENFKTSLPIMKKIMGTFRLK